MIAHIAVALDAGVQATSSVSGIGETAQHTANILSFVAILVSVASLIGMLAVAVRANRIQASDPWATLLVERIAGQMIALQGESHLISSAYKVPFETVDRKRVLRDRLNEERAKFAEAMHHLSALCPSADKVRERKSKLDADDDSYLDNSELSLDPDRAKQLLQKYNQGRDECIGLLRELIAAVISRRVKP